MQALKNVSRKPAVWQAITQRFWPDGSWAEKGNNSGFMNIRVHTISLGMPQKPMDTEWMLGGLGPGLVHAPEPENAEVILINTCAFIEPAVDESYRSF